MDGFVDMLGEQEHSDEEGSFNKINILKRIIIVSSGALINIVFGLLIYFILTSSSGNFISQNIQSVEKGYPASTVGIEKGDKIIQINNKNIKTKSDYEKIMKKSEGNEILIKIKRNDKIIEKKITPVLIEIENYKSYVIGITFEIAENNFTNNIYYGFWDTIDFTKNIADGVRLIFTGNVSTKDLTGPVGISKIVSKTEGINEYIYILAVISISIGVTNLLPIPPLDGGKNVLLLIEAIIRKPINKNIEMSLQLIGFAFLIGLTILVTYNDIFKNF